MRYLRESIEIAALLAAFGIAQALVGARELERVAPTTRVPSLPLSNLLASAGLALMLVLYGALGRAMARSRTGAGLAAARGALAGFGAGLVAGGGPTPPPSTLLFGVRVTPSPFPALLRARASAG